MNPHKLFQKVFLLLAFTLIVLQAAYLGADLQANDGKEALTDGILLVFWIFTFGLFTLMNRAEQKLDRELEESRKNLDKSLDNLLGEILGKGHEGHEHVVKTGRPENQLHESLTDQLVDIIGEVTKDGSPKPKDLPEIKKRFEAKTGHEVVIKHEGLGLNVRIGKEPMAKKRPARKPATTKAPVKKPVAKTAPTIKKPVTKKGK